MLVVNGLQIVLHTKCTGLCVTYFLDTIQMPVSNGSFVVIKPKAKEDIRTATILLFYIS